MRIAYRFKQFRNALRSGPLPEELEPIRQFLSPPLWSLFNKMQPAEQRHSIQVFNRLTQVGEMSPELLTAALLHDVGKVDHPLNPLERSVVVVAKSIFSAWAEHWHTYSAKGWKHPFVVAASHPEWGARAARAAGASEIVENLIRRHHEKLDSLNTCEDQLLRLLQEADEES